MPIDNKQTPTAHNPLHELAEPPSTPAPTGHHGITMVSACPIDAIAEEQGCTWENGTNVLVPAEVRPYCGYFSEGYFGYTFQYGLDPNLDDPQQPFKFPCPPSTTRTHDGTESEMSRWYCIWEINKNGVSFPAGTKPQCDNLARDGTIGYSW